MAIITSRTKEAAHIFIDRELCNDCGVCAEVCKGAPLYMENGKLKIDKERYFGCIGCGQCMVVCPNGAIEISGRELEPEDIFSLPKNIAGYEEFLGVLQRRRSVRNFKDAEIPSEITAKIIDAASYSPMGLPPSDVKLLVFDGRQKVKEFSTDMLRNIVANKKMFSKTGLALMRPFISKEEHELMTSFASPLMNIFEDCLKNEKDWLLYDASLAIYFYSTLYADPADPQIAATYAMLAAEALGIGTCMIGTVGPFLKRSKALKAKYGLPQKHNPGLVVIFGYPKYKFRKGIKRTFADVKFYGN